MLLRLATKKKASFRMYFSAVETAMFVYATLNNVSLIEADFNRISLCLMQILNSHSK